MWRIVVQAATLSRSSKAAMTCKRSATRLPRMSLRLCAHNRKLARPDCACCNPVYHREAMAQKDSSSDIGQMPFERAIEELESIVKRLEEGKVALEESVAIYERGEE